ncbi:hypothetical protein SDC9_126497 [bioreactor metagenome]|uniref:Uncharacterized protein n=1 Tax=bioreactor metagenome TaxID=1076179 RepID=A0A645CRC0_9ZZZZ
MGEASGGEEYAEAVVVAVAVAAGEAAVEFDDPVDGLGAAIVGPAGGEVGQERCPPASEGPPESGDLGDRAGVEGVQDLLRTAASLRGVGCLVGGPQVLGAAPRDVDLHVGLVAVDSGGEPGVLLVGEVLRSCPQDRRDPLQRIPLAAPVPQGGLLDTSTDLVDDLGPELHDVESVQDGGRVGEVVIDRCLVAAERVQRRDTDPFAEVVATGGEPVGVGLLRPSRDQVEQTGVDPAGRVASQVDHAGQLLRACQPACPHRDHPWRRSRSTVPDRLQASNEAPESSHDTKRQACPLQRFSYPIEE